HASSFLDFDGFQAFVKPLGFRRAEDFYTWSSSGNRPIFIPSKPQAIYKPHWKSWPESLGYIDRRRFNTA
ncbi:unnamed protein product, partial [Amoebophrya sp. A25]